MNRVLESPSSHSNCPAQLPGSPVPPHRASHDSLLPSSLPTYISPPFAPHRILSSPSSSPHSLLRSSFFIHSFTRLQLPTQPPTMRLPTLLTALAAVTLPSLSTAQSTTQLTSATTLCRTRYGIYPLPTGTAGVPTWYSSSTTTNTIHSTSTTQTTITVTPDATTFTDVLTSTSVITTTTTSTPDAVTVPTSAGQLLLLGAGALQVAPTPAPTGGMSRIKRAQLADADAAAFLPLKRQTPTGNSAGFIAYPNGTYSGLYRRYAHRVDCRVLVTIDETVVTVVTALPETQVLPQQTETALVTTTVLSTVTETRVAATPTVYAACGADNVGMYCSSQFFIRRGGVERLTSERTVNHIIDINGQPLYFDRVIYRPTEGFPINQEVVLYTDSDIECCEACQTTVSILLPLPLPTSPPAFLFSSSFRRQRNR